MCTAIYENAVRPILGRTLDLEYSYGESVVITPRLFQLRFLHLPPCPAHQAIVGVAYVHGGYPLYYDAMNESGLVAAALSFPESARYRHKRRGFYNLSSAELIPWLLCRCESLSEALSLLTRVNITSDPFSPELPTTPLHWIIADKERSVILETTSAGLRIHDAPVGVLSNSPPLEYQMTHLASYMRADSSPPANTLCPTVTLGHYSRGMGGLGLPGDFSSPSRFVKAVFAKSHTIHPKDSIGQISRFFHLMDTVSQPSGCSLSEDGRPIYTVYTACADLLSLKYYFTTYSCRQIRSVSLMGAPLESDRLIRYRMERRESIARATECGK